MRLLIIQFNILHLNKLQTSWYIPRRRFRKPGKNFSYWC